MTEQQKAMALIYNAAEDALNRKALAAKNANWTPAQIKLITDSVAKNATPDELRLFLYRAKNMGLDPLKPGQIHFVKYGNSPGTIVVGIEGFRSIAGRTGKLTGIKRGVLKDEKGKLVGGWAEVYRSDWTGCAREEVPLSEYNTGRGPWEKMPETMIKKVAECAALRMAFPDDLGGVYEQAEMEQAKYSGPAPEDGNTEIDQDFEYRIPFGQWRKRGLEEVYRNVGPQKIADYIKYLEDKAVKEGREPTPQVKDFIERAEEFLGAMENTEAPNNE